MSMSCSETCALRCQLSIYHVALQNVSFTASCYRQKAIWCFYFVYGLGQALWISAVSEWSKWQLWWLESNMYWQQQCSKYFARQVKQLCVPCRLHVYILHLHPGMCNRAMSRPVAVQEGAWGIPSCKLEILPSIHYLSPFRTISAKLSHFGNSLDFPFSAPSHLFFYYCHCFRHWQLGCRPCQCTTK